MLMLVLWVGQDGRFSVLARVGMRLGGRGGAIGSDRGVVVLGLGRLGGLRQQQQQQQQQQRQGQKQGQIQRQGQGQGQARRYRGGSDWAGRWWRWRLLWTGCEMEMKGLLDGRGRGGWGRVEAVVDQGEERWSRAKLLLSFGGVKGIRTRTGWAAGDGETWRLTGERRAAVQGPILE